MFLGKADVIVCDGFTGNVVLKQAEGIYGIMRKRGIRDEYFDRFNYENYGGTPILGVKGNVIIGHGISNDIRASDERNRHEAIARRRWRYHKRNACDMQATGERERIQRVRAS